MTDDPKDTETPEAKDIIEALADGKPVKDDQETNETNIIRLVDTPDKVKPDKLTPKQIKFCQEVAKGNTLSQAYRNSYQAENMSEAAIWTESSRLAGRPHVSLRIEQLRGAADRVSMHTAASLRTFVERELFRLATEADGDANRLRALHLLGTTEKVGSFLSRTADVTEEMSPDEIQEELTAKLKKAFNE